MKYLQQDRRNRRRGKNTLFTVFILILVFLVLSHFFPKLIPGRVNSLGKPLWRLRESATNNFEEIMGILNSKSALVVENKILKQENLKRDIKLLQLDLIQKENEELKELLGRSSGEGLILSRVLSKPPQSPYDSLIIDLGSKNIKKGQEVFVSNSVLIGHIEEVYSATAKVALLSSPGKTYEVEIGEESISATATGLGGGNFEIRLPRGVDIALGDVVISPSLSIKLLGIVEEIDKTVQNPFQNILFKSPVNITQVKWVEVKTRADG